MRKNRVCVFGIGGSGREIMTCIKQIVTQSNKNSYEIAYFLVDDEYYKQDTVMGIQVVKFSEFNPLDAEVVIAVGNSLDRFNIVKKFPQNTKYAKIIHPSAIISEDVEIQEGTVIAAGVILMCNVQIGKHSQINLQTTVSHDSHVGEFFTSASSVSISGNCFIGNIVNLGANSCVKEKLQICDNVTVGMGGVVINNIEKEGVYVGNPVRKL